MPTPLPHLPKGALRIRFVHNTGGKVWGTGLQANMGGSVTPTQAQLNTMASTVEASWKTQFVPAFDTTTTYVETTVTWSDGAGGEVQGVANSALAGSDANPRLPRSICMVIAFAITAAYRGGKPKMYLSGMTQHLLTSDERTWVPTIITAFNAAISALLAVINAASIGGAAVTAGVWSYYEDAAERGGAPPPVVRTTPLFRAYNAGRAQALIGHQRVRDEL